MNIRTALLPVLLVALAPMLHASESKRTANYILSTPTAFEGKEVTLDVSFVKPSHVKSPIPEIAFFHAATLDRQDHRHGGNILVVIAAEDAAKFAKKYGTNFEGRTESNPLKGTLAAAPGGKRQGQVWLLDTTGKIGELVKQNKLVIEDDEGGRGPDGGPRHPHRPGGF
jgi:hypothetical protein